MKKCYTCQQELNKSHFNKNKGRKDGLNGICKECSRKRSKRYYSENTNQHRKTVQQNSRLYKQQLRNWINTKIKILGCNICNEKEPCCLDFHHVESLEKDNLISYLVNTNSRQKLELELRKCVVVCSNCHRKIHKKLIPSPTNNHLKNIVVPKGSITSGLDNSTQL